MDGEQPVVDRTERETERRDVDRRSRGTGVVGSEPAHIQAALMVGAGAAIIFLVVGALGMARMVLRDDFGGTGRTAGAGGVGEPLVVVDVPPAVAAVEEGMAGIDELFGSVLGESDGVWMDASGYVVEDEVIGDERGGEVELEGEGVVEGIEDGVRFNGRLIRPVRVMHMRVTAYSPDARSTAPFNDNVTASGYSVWTNGGNLVAADTSVLGFGAVLTIPGYDDGLPVPVLDRGGAIKAYRLDVLFPTHESALEWGVRWLDVTEWEYVE